MDRVLIEQGSIYLVNFGKKYNSEFGKIRPVVVLQNDFLNFYIQESEYKSVLVVPLSTVQATTEYKIEIKARDRLKKDSFIVANWICSLDIDRILTEYGVITKLRDDELSLLKDKICSLI